MPPRLNPCRSCGKPRVIRPGDYCRDCAIRWRQPSAEGEYLVVTPHTLDEAVELTGMGKSYLRAKQEQAFFGYAKYVIFEANGEWHDVVVSDVFYLPKVMENLIRLLEG